MQAYLDHAATTPLRPQALAAMLPLLTERFGNPSGAHSVARDARRCLDDAREGIARDLGCEPGEVVFTAGGTESDNLAVLGSHERPGDVVCSAVEHHAVLRPCQAVGGVVVEVDASGSIDLDALSDSLEPEVRLVSVMLANNEIGTVQPLSQVAELVRRRAPEALLHTDAVAAVGWFDVASATRCSDLVSVSAHKFGGPKGVGALVVRRGVRLGPVLRGGEQERGRRPGTHDVAGAVGMAAALAVATSDREAAAAHVARLRDRLGAGILGAVDGAVETGPVSPTAGTAGTADTVDNRARTRKLPSSLNVRFESVDAEELLVLLDQAGICASAGAACASGAVEPSHVLLATGLSRNEARTAVRFSLGVTTTDEEIDYTLEVVPKLVEQLRS
ncbi:MAG: cysteine desulfurase family protein [Acidimicrobiales bacterium]